MACGHCESGELIRTHRRAFAEHLFACVGLYPYICKKCKRRCLRPRLEQMAMVACFVVLAMVAMGTVGLFVYRMRHASLMGPGVPASGARLTPVALNEPQSPVLDWRSTLRNDDIVELSRSGLAGEVIAKLISKSPHQFDVDTKSLASMKRSGVKDEVIALIIDVSLSAAPPSTTPSAPTGTPGGSAPAEHGPIIKASGVTPAIKPASAPEAAPVPTAFARMPGLGGGTN